MFKDLQKLECVFDGGVVVTDWSNGTTEGHVNGPYTDGDVLIALRQSGPWVATFLPVSVLANHLRQAGWTVVPPEGDL